MIENKKAENVVALRYHENEDNAPKLVAKGKGEVARKIKELAQKNGIPIYRDDDLVNLLSQIEIDREIPPELYSAIAEILSWIYRANSDMREDRANR